LYSDIPNVNQQDRVKIVHGHKSYVRVGAMDSAIVCFTDSYKQRLQGMKTESVPDILINLADAMQADRENMT